MTARREKQQRRSAVRSGPGRDSRSPRVVRARMPWPWIMAGFAAMVLAAVLIVRVMVPARTTAPVAVAMRPPEAYRRAADLTNRGYYRESFPFYVTAIAGVREDFWELHYNYAAALMSLSLQYVERGHLRVTSTVSSVERVRLMQEAIPQLTLAAELARAGADRAKVLSRRSNTFAVWGFPWESLLSLRQAERADPSQIALARQGNALLRLLIDPTSAKLDRGGRAGDTTASAPPVARP